MDIHAEAELKDVLALFKQGNPFDAQNIINSLLERNLESSEIDYVNTCYVFWTESLNRLNAINDIFERSAAILSEWKTFQNYIEKTYPEEKAYEPAFFSMQYGFFSNALQDFEKLPDIKDSLQKAEIYRNIGIYYKKLGDFERAKDFLTEANRIHPNISSVIAELADSCALCGIDKFAKLFFREAFFLNPDDVDLEFLDSELIKCLIEKTKQKGYDGKRLRYWIPVYGVLNGVFNIKRELTSVEVARLKKDIYAMEMENKDPSCNSEILLPKLLNSYFWLMDHYDLTRENPAKINEVLVKIRVLDSSVYEAYTK